MLCSPRSLRKILAAQAPQRLESLRAGVSFEADFRACRGAVLRRDDYLAWFVPPVNDGVSAYTKNVSACFRCSCMQIRSEQR